MSSRSEKGHAKNVANFETEILFCTAYGTAYNPSNSLLTIESLNTQLSLSRTSLAEVITIKNQLDLIKNERQAAFMPLKRTATRIINALEATDISKQTIEKAKSINKKIQGQRSNTKPNEEKKRISTSQQSYDSLVENFSKLIDLISSEIRYTPNETELKITTLDEYTRNLCAISTNVIIANTMYSNVLISRDNILYAVDTGLVDTALSVKKYVKSLFGTTSPQYKQISKLEFTRPTKA